MPDRIADNDVPTGLTEAEVALRLQRHGYNELPSPDGFRYDQVQREFVVPLKGAARLRFEDEVIEMRPG